MPSDSAAPQLAPSGLVAFLFTDIEGSTARWDANREAMQAAVRRHDAVLRDAIESRGGYVFKTIGDAFCAAFAGVAAALEAALEAQRAIAREDWSAVNGLRVRMAIHAGETDERSGDYFGPPVNRVARLLAAGHGGQVLLSGFAADLAAPHLPPGVGLRNLGVVPLKDLKEPERAFQLTAPDLAAEFKPLRALETPPNNLPHPQGSFVGRFAELMELEELIRTSRLVTVAGSGGMGKTRLALEAARELLPETGGGAWFVDLAPLSDPALVASTILTALGVDQTGSAPPLERLVAHLKARSLLLVLDNCEHVIDEAARAASAVLAGCPETSVLATSREVLNVSGERIFRIASLEPDAALALFVQRAQAVNPRFALDDANRATAAGICAKLDGIALAIELAAARMRSVTVEDLARRLQLRSLGGGSRDRTPRQQTMEALIGWSYDLLSGEEKALLRRLSVFAGGCTLDAAAAVSASGDDEWQVLDGITSLVDKSLLSAEAHEAHQRYRFLESIRQYARERLDESGETPALQRRHAEFFAVFADRAYEEFDTDPQSGWLRRMELDLDNVRAALGWAIDGGNDAPLGARIAAGMAPAFMRLSLLREAIGWCERALQSRAVAPAVEARLHYVLSMLYNNQGVPEASFSSAAKAVELSRGLGDERAAARALAYFAQKNAQMLHFDEARAASAEALALARRLGDSRLLASTLQRCATALEASEIETARERLRESVALFRSLGRDDETARALLIWVDLEGLAGEFRRAAELGEQALPIAGDDTRLYLVNALACVYVGLGEMERAAPMAREALLLAANAAHPLLLATSVFYVASVASERAGEEAVRLLGFTENRLAALGWTLEDAERRLYESLHARLEERFGDAFGSLLAEGAAWSEEQAVARAIRV